MCYGTAAGPVEPHFIATRSLPENRNKTNGPRLGYPELAKKSESYEICFVPDNDYRGFLKRRVEGLEEKVNGGNFVDKYGKHPRPA